MPVAESSANDPVLILARPRRFRNRRLIGMSAAAMCALLVGLVLNHASGRGISTPVVTVKGIMASKNVFFDDAEVKRLLRARNIQVEVTTRGSRDVALEVIGQETDQYDFAFPSGQPAADLITADRRQREVYHKEFGLFSSPIVFASYREYARTLAAQGVAAPLDAGPENSLHYVLDMDAFIALGESGRTWNDIGIERYFKNGNRVLALNPGVCRSNSGATYLGLVAFVKNGGNPPRNEAEVDVLAEQLQPLFTATGMPEAELFRGYLTPEGKSRGPIVVVYEHQYLAYQIAHKERTGKLDTDRVLLYPGHEFQTDPTYISLNEGPGDDLARLLVEDPLLRKRMVELGFRVFDQTGENTQLPSYLAEMGIPTPERTDATRALMPNLDLLESLIGKTGRCRR